MDVLLVPKPRHPGTEVNIVYTTPEATRAALATATSYSKDLEISVRILAFQVVPYPLDIDSPAICPDFAVNQILAELEPPNDTDFTLHYALCRDQNDALIRSLKTQSMVVIAGTNGLVASREQRLARNLENIGHQVVFVRINGDRNERRWTYRILDFVRHWLLGFGYGSEHSLERK